QTFNASAGDLLISGTNLGTNTNFAGPGTVTLTITGAHMTTISSRITDDPFTGLTPLFILKQGTGTLVLGGFNNTYTGGVEIDAGRLEVASFTALGLGNTTIFIGTLATFGPNALPFTVGNNFNMVAGFPLAIWEVKVGGLIPGITADYMTTGTNANLAGELFVHRINNFMPLPGDEVNILTTNGTRNGFFQIVASDFPG